MSGQFIRRDEIDRVHPVKDKTRKRAEAAGLFPRRIKLAPRVSAWRRSEVEAWQADPAGWVARRAV
jgi:predicted DNA-binding transcriptional regulator AlpA